MKQLDPRIRISVYIGLMAVGGVLVTFEIIDGVTLDSLGELIGGLLLVSGGGLATANTDVKARKDAPGVHEWAMMGRDAVPAILDEISRLRDDVAGTRNGAQQPAEPVEAPDAAPWLDGADYVGQRRRE